MEVSARIILVKDGSDEFLNPNLSLLWPLTYRSSEATDTLLIALGPSTKQIWNQLVVTGNKFSV